MGAAVVITCGGAWLSMLCSTDPYLSTWRFAGGKQGGALVFKVSQTGDIIMKKKRTWFSRIAWTLTAAVLVTAAEAAGVSETALAAGWSFDKETEVWTYYNAPQITHRTEDLKKGWHFDAADGHRYYFDLESGHMLYGHQNIDGKAYFFADVRNRENYFEQEDGFWYYRANGLVPFGALMEDAGRAPADNETFGGGNTQPAEPEKPIEPEQPTEPEKPTEPERVPCIEVDSWDIILKQPTAYVHCLEHACEKELLVKGYRVEQGGVDTPLVATDSCTEAVRVSVIGIEADGSGTATFAMAEVSDAFSMPMNASPYYCYLRDELFDSFSTGGWKESLPYAALNGGTYTYATGAGETASLKLPAFRLYYENDQGRKKEIQPHAVEKISGAGYFFEMMFEGEQGLGKPELGYPRDKARAKLWLLSELELTGEAANSIAGERTYAAEDGAVQHGGAESEAAPYAAVKALDEAHWTRSAASHAVSDEGYFVTNAGMTAASEALPLRFGFVIK